MTAVIGWSIVAFGAVIGLLAVDAPMAVAAAVALGSLAVLGLWPRLRRLAATARRGAYTVFCAACCLAMALTGSLPPGWHSTPRGRHARRSPRHVVWGRLRPVRWTPAEQAALADDQFLRYLLKPADEEHGR